MKVENEGVDRKRDNGHCMKQVRIPKATRTSPILRKRYTCCKASLMNDNVKVKVPKTLIPLHGVLKFGDRLEGDHVTHF